MSKANSPVWLRTTAIWISALSNPVLLVALSLVYLTNRYADDLGELIRYSATGLSLIVIGPALAYIAISSHRERSIDIDVSNRADRPLPLMIASIGALVGGSLISSRFEIPNLLFMSQTLVMMLLILTIISFVWKISIHTTTLSAVVTLIVVFRGAELLPLYALIVPVAWARLYLRQHTLPQIIGGILIGIAVTSLSWLVLGN